MNRPAPLAESAEAAQSAEERRLGGRGGVRRGRAQRRPGQPQAADGGR